jgi:tetratricopeptide (TPR) repeat protein
MSDQIFISYRRDDAAYVTGHINDRLRKEFGDDSIFTDVDRIALGVDFRTTLDLMVSQCQILLAVIGHDWLTVKNKDGQVRLQDPTDFFRIEIESALARDIPVIPLLVAGTKMPSKDELPESLEELAFRNGTQIRPDPDFHTDIDRLIKSLKGHLVELSDGADPSEIVENMETAQEPAKQEKDRTLKIRMPKLVFWPLVVAGVALMAGGSWYVWQQYEGQIRAANAALEEVQKSAAEAEAKREADALAEARREADADADAKREADAIAEAGRQADVEAQRLSDVEAQRKADADDETQLQAEADAEAQLKADAYLEVRRQVQAEARREAERKVSASAAINRGMSLAGRGDHVAAVENYSEAIALGADPAFVHKQRGASYFSLGDYEAAIKDYDVAIRLNEKNANAYYSRSKSHFALENFEAAREDCNTAIGLGPDYANAYYENGCRIAD